MQEMANAPGGVDAMTEFFLNLQVWGTPEQCYEKILDIQKRTGAEAFIGVFSYAGMPYDLAEASMRLFAAEVMPELQASACRSRISSSREPAWARRPPRARSGSPSDGLASGQRRPPRSRPASRQLVELRRVEGAHLARSSAGTSRNMSSTTRRVSGQSQPWCG